MNGGCGLVVHLIGRMMVPDRAGTLVQIKLPGFTPERHVGLKTEACCLCVCMSEGS